MEEEYNNCGTPHIYAKNIVRYIMLKDYMIVKLQKIVHIVEENLSQMDNYKYPVEYVHIVQSLIPLPRSKIYHCYNSVES